MDNENYNEPIDPPRSYENENYNEPIDKPRSDERIGGYTPRYFDGLTGLNVALAEQNIMDFWNSCDDSWMKIGNTFIYFFGMRFIFLLHIC